MLDNVRQQILEAIANRIDDGKKLNIFITGDWAVNYYTDGIFFHESMDFYYSSDKHYASKIVKDALKESPTTAMYVRCMNDDPIIEHEFDYTMHHIYDDKKGMLDQIVAPNGGTLVVTYQEPIELICHYLTPRYLDGKSIWKALYLKEWFAIEMYDIIKVMRDMCELDIPVQAMAVYQAIDTFRKRFGYGTNVSAIKALYTPCGADGVGDVYKKIMYTINSYTGEPETL